MPYRWWALGSGLVIAVLVAGLVITRGPGRPLFWIVGILGALVYVGIGAALAWGWRPRRARPLLGAPSVWDRDTDPWRRRDTGRGPGSGRDGS